jgi:hypothetical protein
MKIWVTTQPGPRSTVGDCVFKATALEYLMQVDGGLSTKDKPEFHATQADAIADYLARGGKA